jgi:hypothetical protein
MLVVSVTILIAAAWWLLSAAVGRGSVSERAVLALTGTTGQIVLTCTLLGAVGALTRAAAIACALVAAAGLGAVALAPEAGRSKVLDRLASDVRAIRFGFRAAFGWENAVLAAALLFAGLWLLAAIVVYPPRGIDDLVYHLPPVYQAVQDHRISILPLELRNLFAFPLTGEMTFLWIALLDGSVRWVDAAQGAFAVLAILSVFVIGRRFGLTHRGALFAAGLFGTMPVILPQAASNYVDLITAAWVLAAAAALLVYEKTGCRFSLAIGGLAAGLFLGSKYLMIPLALAVVAAALAAVPGRETGRGRRATAVALFAVPALAACGYWYVRNWFVFGNPLYPLPVRVLGMTLFNGPWEHAPSTWSVLAADPREIFRVAVWDPGLGSLHGGYGFLFWGFAAPSVIFTAQTIFRRDGWSSPGRMIVLSMAPLGMATLFVSTHTDLWVAARFVIFVGGIVSVALALLVEEASGLGIGAAGALRAAGAACGCLGLLASAQSAWPLMNLAPAAADPPALRAMTEQRYLRNTGWDLRPMSAAWAPLDAMTRGAGGLSVYQAGDLAVFWTAPTYGTEMQNRIWNFDRTPVAKPDAYFFHSPRGKPFFVGKPVQRAEVAADPAFELVASDGDDATTLYVSRAALSEKGRLEKLAAYYEQTAPDMVRATEASAAALEPGSVVLVPFPLAAGYLVHRARGRCRSAIDPVTTKDVETAARRAANRVIYTFPAPLPGMTAAPGPELEYRGKRFRLIRNAPAGEARSAGKQD